MSEIYPIEDLVWNNKTTSASIRAQLLTLKQMSRNELKEFFEDFVELGLADQQPISDAIGVLFDEDSVWSTLRVGELKAMLSLATGDVGQAAAWCQWCLSFNSLPAPRLRLYRVISDLINFELTGENPTDYHLALEQIYDHALLATAQQIVNRRETFYGLNFAPTWEEISPAHANLLSLYKKLHRLKTEGNQHGRSNR
jgi:ribosomal protein S12 methylthiotransferase accessory factor